MQHRIIHHRTLKIWSASPPPVSFVIICPSLVTLITGIATLAILLIPTHDDDDDDVVMAPMAKRMLLSYGPICMPWASIVISKKAFMSYEPILELGVHEFNDCVAKEQNSNMSIHFHWANIWTYDRSPKAKGACINFPLENCAICTNTQKVLRKVHLILHRLTN